MISSITGSQPGSIRPLRLPIDAMQQAFAAADVSTHSRVFSMLRPGLMRTPLIPRLFRYPATDLYAGPNLLSIPGGLTIVHNPKAGNNGNGSYANVIERTIDAARSTGDIAIRGAVGMLQTLPERRERISYISDYLNRIPETGWHYMLVVGGDATFADVVTAIAKSQVANRVIAVPLMGGTANDGGRMHGAARSPDKLLDFLKHAKPQRLDVGRVWLNGVEQEAYLTQSFTFGMSGELFYQMEQRRAELSGRYKNLQYIPTLLREIRDTKFFKVRVAGNELITGEVVVTGSTGLGGITNVPLRKDGFMTYVIPVDPRLPGVLSITGSTILVEAVLRKFVGLAGFKELALAGRFLTMSPERQVQLPLNDELEIFVTDNSEAPKIRAVLNGDSIDENVEHVRVRSLGRPVTTLALPDSELAIRQRPLG
ncbi:MAG: hypothetical protein HN337_01415 [Deltaproteobacteria bacterium]|jgi:diacylglycerol kinase family enzyme|nr:hypothetical protein [Deltaproteobacteria bacterium]